MVEIMGTTCGLHKASQQKPEIKMGLYQERHSQFEIKRTEKVGRNDGRLSDFLDSTGPNQRTSGLYTYAIL